jgi:hypothetical protein
VFRNPLLLIIRSDLNVEVEALAVAKTDDADYGLLVTYTFVDGYGQARNRTDGCKATLTRTDSCGG